MSNDKIEDLELKIQMLMEKIEYQNRVIDALHKSKMSVCQVICKEGENYRRLMVLESHETAEGIRLVVEK